MHYTTKPDEIILLREGYAYFDAKKVVIPSGELILTTESIVFNETHSFAQDRLLIILPIKKIQMYSGKPQVKCSSTLGDN